MAVAKEIKNCNSLEELMKLWYSFYNDPDFMTDGLMRNGFENMWPDFGCRVLFLLKEGNGNGGDVITWLNDTGKDDNYTINRKLGYIGKKRTIFHPLAYILFGIHYLSDHQMYCRFDSIPDNANFKHIKVPFAYVEAKKTPGGSTSNNKEIRSYIETHQDFLKREIELLSPTIIICCDNYSCNLEKTMGSWKYDAITSYHLSARKSLRDKYNFVITKYRYFQLKNLISESYTKIDLYQNKILFIEYKYGQDKTIVLDLNIYAGSDNYLVVKTRSENKKDIEEVMQVLDLHLEWQNSYYIFPGINNNSTNNEISYSINKLLFSIKEHYPLYVDM